MKKIPKLLAVGAMLTSELAGLISGAPTFALDAATMPTNVYDPKFVVHSLDLKTGRFNFTVEHPDGLKISQVVIAYPSMTTPETEESMDAFAAEMWSPTANLDWVSNYAFIYNSSYDKMPTRLEASIKHVGFKDGGTARFIDEYKMDFVYYMVQFVEMVDGVKVKQSVIGKLDYRTCAHDPKVRSGEISTCWLSPENKVEGEKMTFLPTGETTVGELDFKSWAEELGLPGSGEGEEPGEDGTEAREDEESGGDKTETEDPEKTDNSGEDEPAEKDPSGDETNGLEGAEDTKNESEAGSDKENDEEVKNDGENVAQDDKNDENSQDGGVNGANSSQNGTNHGGLGYIGSSSSTTSTSGQPTRPAATAPSTSGSTTGGWTSTTASATANTATSSNVATNTANTVASTPTGVTAYNRPSVNLPSVAQVASEDDTEKQNADLQGEALDDVLEDDAKEEIEVPVLGGEVQTTSWTQKYWWLLLIPVGGLLAFGAWWLVRAFYNKQS